MNEAFSWRKQITPGTVDPITLDPLDKLPYPPFALKVTPPYDGVPEWPVPSTADSNSNHNLHHNAEDRLAHSNEKVKNEDSTDENSVPAGEEIQNELNKQLRQKKLLEEQLFNDETIVDEGNNHTTDTQASHDRVGGECGSGEGEHYHLFDGKALACYLVSQLQFIDPLNRRDLTRDELVQLEAYLLRHNLNNVKTHKGRIRRLFGKGWNQTGTDSPLKVLEAYDARGVNISGSLSRITSLSYRREYNSREPWTSDLSAAHYVFSDWSSRRSRSPSVDRSFSRTASRGENYSRRQRRSEASVGDVWGSPCRDRTARYPSSRSRRLCSERRNRRSEESSFTTEDAVCRSSRRVRIARRSHRSSRRSSRLYGERRRRRNEESSFTTENTVRRRGTFRVENYRRAQSPSDTSVSSFNSVDAVCRRNQRARPKRSRRRSLLCVLEDVSAIISAAHEVASVPEFKAVEQSCSLQNHSLTTEETAEISEKKNLIMRESIRKTEPETLEQSCSTQNDSFSTNISEQKSQITENLSRKLSIESDWVEFSDPNVFDIDGFTSQAKSETSPNQPFTNEISDEQIESNVDDRKDTFVKLKTPQEDQSTFEDIWNLA